MKNKSLTIMFISFIFIFLILNIIFPDKEISNSERRNLVQFSSIKFNDYINGKSSDKLEKYIADQFIFRDSFRRLKTFFNNNIYGKSVTNNLLVLDNYIYKLDYTIDDKSILNFNNKMNILYDKYLKDMNTYYIIIPDKNYYSSLFLKMDYDSLYEKITNNLKFNYIDIRDILELNDYYYTDTHIKQPSMLKIANKLSKIMNFNISNNYKTESYSPFYGVYYGQLGKKMNYDTIEYLVNDEINNAIVINIEDDYQGVYNLEKVLGMDSYDLFLSGATPLITIVNPNNNSNRELILFRDSYGSSLAPLLIHGYKKITLVDIRYIRTDLLSNYIEFNNQDVLIEYSTMVVNNSYSLK